MDSPAARDRDSCLNHQPSRWKMPDLPVCFPRVGENQQLV
jgi:hypothetical protein